MDNQNEKYLNLLSIFHYVVAGLAALFSLLPVFHLIIGITMLTHPEAITSTPDEFPMWFGYIFTIIPAVIIMFGLTFSLFILINGRKLAKRKNYTFCLVMAGVECIFVPFGTVLGIFTLIVLLREDVRNHFQDI